MSLTIKILIGILIPFVGTSIGAAPVLFMSRDFDLTLKRILLGFAAGVMIAASVWSLLLPAIEMSSGSLAFVPAVTGFLTGVVFLAALDALIVRLRRIPREDADSSRSVLMTAVAVTLHNIPEGMAVGVAFAGISGGVISYPEALALAIGIGIQNFPEGAIISMPLRSAGMSRGRALVYGVLSGVVEPLSAALTLALTAVIAPILPYILAFAAGAMIYVVTSELIPESQCPNGSLAATLSTAAGFSLMMLLDVALG